MWYYIHYDTNLFKTIFSNTTYFLLARYSYRTIECLLLIYQPSEGTHLQYHRDLPVHHKSSQYCNTYNDCLCYAERFYNVQQYVSNVLNTASCT